MNCGLMTYASLMAFSIAVIGPVTFEMSGVELAAKWLCLPATYFTLSLDKVMFKQLSLHEKKIRAYTDGGKNDADLKLHFSNI